MKEQANLLGRPARVLQLYGYVTKVRGLQHQACTQLLPLLQQYCVLTYV